MSETSFKRIEFGQFDQVYEPWLIIAGPSLEGFQDSFTQRLPVHFNMKSLTGEHQQKVKVLVRGMTERRQGGQWSYLITIELLGDESEFYAEGTTFQGLYNCFDRKGVVYTD